MYMLSADVAPSAVHVGNIVQGVRMAWAQGRDLGAIDDESDAAKKVSAIICFCSVLVAATLARLFLAAVSAKVSSTAMCSAQHGV